MNGPAQATLEGAVREHFGVPPEDAAAVLAELETVLCRGGDWLFRQGDPGDSLYLLVRGRLQVWIDAPDADGAARLVAEIEPGETIGEIGLLAGGARSASVRAVRDSLLLKMGAEAFDSLGRRRPEWVRRMAGRIATRLRDRTGATPSRHRGLKTVALVPLEDAASAQEFAARLAGALGRDVETLDATRLRTLGAPSGGLDGAAMVDWLAAVEDRNRFVLYVADAADSPWSRLAVRHADLIVLVADARATPAPRAWETALLGAGAVASRALVLRHPAGATPAGTDAWLAERTLDFHLHLRDGVDADLGRLARVLSGTALGLVLGGGAARGFAHLGVYRALAEAGHTVDWVGGSSIGAVMGAAIARGVPADEATTLARKAFVDGKPFGDVTLPLVSILRGRRMERLIGEYLPGRIEDMPVPYFCVSSNLGSGTLQIHDRGDLPLALRASVALPGVFPPAVVNRQLTIDGGILDNLPVDPMRRRPVGRVVAVDLTSRQTFEVAYDAAPSPWAVLAGRVLPFVRRPRVPSLMSLMLKATEIGTIADVRAAGRRADLLIRPPVSRFGLTDVRSFDRIVQAGYDEAREAIAAWQC